MQRMWEYGSTLQQPLMFQQEMLELNSTKTVLLWRILMEEQILLLLLKMIAVLFRLELLLLAVLQRTILMER